MTGKYTRQSDYAKRLRDSGGAIVAVRMTREQLAALDACRLKTTIPESRSACLNRLVAQDCIQRRLDDLPT